MCDEMIGRVSNLKYESVRTDFKAVVLIKANPGKKETTDGLGLHVNFIQKQCTFPEVVSPEKWYVTNIKPLAYSCPPKTYPHRPNVYSHCHVYSSLARSGQQSGNDYFTSYGEPKFMVTCHFLELSTSGKVHRFRKKMHPNPICVWFLSYLGWLLYENHCLGINAHTHISGWTPYDRCG